MLCTTCRNKPHCLAAQLAQGDAALDQLLRRLKRCNLRPRRTRWQQVRFFWRSVWSALRLNLNR